MAPILCKYISVHIMYYITYTLYKAHIHRRSQWGPRRHGPSKFLEYLVILCFKRQYLKQNTVARLKSNILTHPQLWAGQYTAHVRI